MPDGGNPFFGVSETNQPLCSVGVENTDLLSVGREYRLTVFAHRVEDEMVVRAVNEVITGSFSFIPTLQASFERCLGDSNSAAVEGIDAHLLELQ